MLNFSKKALGCFGPLTDRPGIYYISHPTSPHPSTSHWPTHTCKSIDPPCSPLLSMLTQNIITVNFVQSWSEVSWLLWSNTVFLNSAKETTKISWPLWSNLLKSEIHLRQKYHLATLVQPSGFWVSAKWHREVSWPLWSNIWKFSILGF